MDKPRPSRLPPITETKPDQAPVTVRRFLTGDSIEEITHLLHRAYARQKAIGLDPLAGRQDYARTLDRVLNSECFLAFMDHEQDNQRIVGVILLNEHEQVTFPEYFLRDGVAHFAMFAVDPTLQAIGVGTRLLDTCVRRARELGNTQMALSMAKPDAALLRYYERRGYEQVQEWQWPYTNYVSLILAKDI
ncbi:MAG: GNAT family N-acetyltransferase [Phycisphaerales bacterium]|nr:GNAT family N-acetyltransferase [Phycisphaerales bacterium]